MSTPPPSRPRAAIAIIGNEILSGRVVDENGPYMARRLDEAGLELRRISVLPDEEELLADWMRQWSGRVEHVFTTGGIGPTHDDLTRRALARATGLPLEPHPGALRILEEFYGERLTAVRRAMALLPRGAELVANPISAVPGCRVRNLAMLAGVPQVLRTMFDAVLETIDGRPHHHEAVETRIYEGDFAEWLSELAAAHPAARIGSYPRLGDPRVRSVITIDAPDPAQAAALRHLVEEGLAQWK